VSGDGINTQYTAFSNYSASMQGTAQSRRTERESRLAGMDSQPFQGLSGSEAAGYRSFLNTALCHVDQIRFPAYLPNLEELPKKEAHGTGSQENSKAHENAQEHSAHASPEGHGAHEGSATHGESEGHKAEGGHGGHETKKRFIEGTHTSEGLHKSIEEISRFARAERSAASVAESLEASAAELGQATKHNVTAGMPVLNAAAGGAAVPNIVYTSAGSGLRTYTSTIDLTNLPENVTTTAPRGFSPATYTTTTSGPFEYSYNYSGTSPVEAAHTPLAESARPASSIAAESSEAGQAAQKAAHGAGHGGGFHKVMGTAEKILAPAAVLAGGFEVAHGISELREGKTALGAFDVAGGAAGVTGGAAATVNAFGLASAPATAAALGTVAGVGFGAVAVIDGAKTIYQGIKEKDTEKTVIGGVKTAAGGAMIAGVCTANPVLIVGGAVTYAGAVIYENREAIAEGAKKAYNYTAEKVGQGLQATKQFAGNVAHNVAAKAQSIKSDASALIDSGVKKAGELKDVAVQKAVEAKNAVAQKASEVKQAVGSALSSAGSTISNAASATVGGAKSAWKWATSWI